MQSNTPRLNYVGTNTYLIFPPPSSTSFPTYTDCLLIDAGQGSAFPKWTSSLLHALVLASIRLGTEVRITQCVLTHWHHDHVGGINELLKICTESDSESSSDQSQNDLSGVKFYKFPLYDPDQQSRERESQLLSSANNDHTIPPLHDLYDGQILTVGSESEKLQLKVLHTPGHTSDHIALIITSSPADPTEVGNIFTGDAVLGHGTAVFEDLTLYMRSLEKMKKAVQHLNHRRSNATTATQSKQFNGKAIALPGHGAVIHDAQSKIQEYIDHRRMREKEVLNVMSSGSASASVTNEGVFANNGLENQAWTPMQIVKIVYQNVPESLHPAAMGGVVQILRKLERERLIERLGTGDKEVENDSAQRWRIVKGQAQQQESTNSNTGESRESAL